MPRPWLDTIACALTVGIFVVGCGRFGGYAGGEGAGLPDSQEVPPARPPEIVAVRREVKLTFVNNTTQDKTVSVALAGEAERTLGTVLGHGGEMQQTITMDTRQLPAPFAWTAGKYRGVFMITRRSPGEVVIPIGHRAKPAQAAGRPTGEWDDD